MPHPAAALIISLHLIKSVSVWEAFFCREKLGKNLSNVIFPDYIHYFLIDVRGRFPVIQRRLQVNDPL